MLRAASAGKDQAAQDVGVMIVIGSDKKGAVVWLDGILDENRPKS
jgi:hypothetical protein